MPTRENRRNLRSRESRIFIPSDRLFPKRKIEIDWKDGSGTEDITDYVEGHTVALRATESLNYVSVKIFDYQFHFKDKFQGGETVRVYMGYNTASTLMITARVVDWDFSYQPTGGIAYSFRAVAYPEFNEKKISITFDNRPLEDAFQDVAEEYDELTYNITNKFTSIRVTLNFQRATGLSILKEICRLNRLEFYIDATGVIFLVDPTSEESKINDEAAVLQQNLMAVQSWKQSVGDVKNRVTLSGKQDEFVTYLRTVNDATNQTSLWVKDDDIFDSSINTMSELKNRATLELNDALSKSSEIVGRINCIGGIGFQPGKRVYISAPPLIDGWYTIKSCSHNLEDGWTSSMSVGRESNNLSTQIVKRKRSEKGLRPSSLDKVYDDCVVIDFKDARQYTLAGCSLDGDELKLNVGETSGTISVSKGSPGLESDQDTTAAFVKINGRNYENCTVTVSNDGGNNTISFTGSSLNSEEKSFIGQNNSHTISVGVQQGAEGSVAIRNVGVFLLHNN